MISIVFSWATHCTYGMWLYYMNQKTGRPIGFFPFSPFFGTLLQGAGFFQISQLIGLNYFTAFQVVIPVLYEKKNNPASYLQHFKFLTTRRIINLLPFIRTEHMEIGRDTMYIKNNLPRLLNCEHQIILVLNKVNSTQFRQAFGDCVVR